MIALHFIAFLLLFAGLGFVPYFLRITVNELMDSTRSSTTAINLVLTILLTVAYGSGLSYLAVQILKRTGF